MVPAPISAADFISRTGVSSGHIGNLADLALGEEQMPQGARLVGFHQFLELLAFECDTLGERQAGCRLDACGNRQGRRIAAPRLADALARCGEERLRGLIECRGQLAGTAHALTLFQKPVGVGNCCGTQIGGNNLVHETGFLRFLA